MLVYKDGDTQKDILGFQCDRCNHTTLTSVIPNDHGEFRYTCPKCGYKMNDKPAEKEEEIKMTNAYTVSNAAKRLNCSTQTIVRGIYDGRFHDCFTEVGHTGRPAWMIPSDQVEAWVTNGGFLLSKRHKDEFMSRSQVRAALEKAKEEAASKVKNKNNQDEMKLAAFDIFQKNTNVTEGTVAKRDANGKPIAGRFPWGKDESVRTVFDPETGKDVPVLDLLSEEDKKPIPEPVPSKPMNEFEKRAVRRVAKSPTEKKYIKVLDRGDTDGDDALFKANPEETKEVLKKMQDSINREIVARPPFIPVDPSPVVRKDGGFSITIPTDLIEDMVYKQLKSELADAVGQMRVALALANETMKKLEEAIA